MLDKGRIKTSQSGFTLIELLIVVNIVAILTAIGSITVSEYSHESRCLEIYNIFAQIIRTQAFHFMQHNQYYAANHNDLKGHGVDLSEAGYFTYSTFTDEDSGFSIRADATGWAPGGWVLYKKKGSDTWECDGVMIQRSWLP